jgi:hypothetical protein
LSRIVWEYFVGVEFDAQAVRAVFGEAVFHYLDTMGRKPVGSKVLLDLFLESLEGQGEGTKDRGKAR